MTLSRPKLHRFWKCIKILYTKIYQLFKLFNTCLNERYFIMFITNFYDTNFLLIIFFYFFQFVYLYKLFSHPFTNIVNHVTNFYVPLRSIPYILISYHLVTQLDYLLDHAQTEKFYMKNLHCLTSHILMYRLYILCEGDISKRSLLARQSKRYSKII